MNSSLDISTPVGPLVTVSHLGVTFDDISGDLEAIDDLSFTLGANEFLCVLGPSGSGKSTLLRVISGLLEPTAGEVAFRDQNRLPKVGLVFQQANLMPWRTAIENIALPLELAGMPESAIRQKSTAMIELVGLEEFAHSYPDDLSGGMAQRVSIARALIQQPDILLLDEPFGALDALTRERMGGELLRIWQTTHTAVIMVTHSIPEALLLSDRVLVLSARPGRILLDMTVNLPRPRSEEIRYSPGFLELERRLRKTIQ